MDAGSGARRNPARYLALLALAAVVAAIYLVVHHYVSPAASTQGTASAQTRTSTQKPKHDSATGSHPSPARPQLYIVRPGDSLSVIASRTGVTLGALEALNPGLRADQIQPGQRLRLRR
jgi:LysM repeat protein